MLDHIMIWMSKLLQQLLQLSVLHHFVDNVQAAYKFSLDDKLRESRPVVQDFEARTNAVVRKDVEVGELHVLVTEGGDNPTGETTSGLIRATFHEQDNLILVHEFVQTCI